MSNTVLVLGAGGILGRRVARLLGRDCPGIRVVPASRRGAARLGPSARTADVRVAESLPPALAGASVVVNAVGPYDYDPAPLVGACVAAGAHYVDLAERQEFVARVGVVAGEVRAAEVGVVAVPGCSTVPGLIELLGAPWLRPGVADRVDAWLSMGSANAVSPGLVHGLIAPLGRPAPDGERYFGKTRERTIGGRRLRFARHPSGAEHRAVPVRLYVGFDRAVLVHALRFAAPLLGRVPEAKLARLARWLAPAAAVARPFGTPRGVLRVEGVAPLGEVLGSVEVEARSEGLDVPALPAVWVAGRLASEPSAHSGVAALADLVTRAEALKRLEAAGLEVREG